MRTVHTVFDATSGAGLAINSGPLDVSGFDQLVAFFVAAGAAAPATVQAVIIDDDQVNVGAVPVALGIGGTGSATFGPGLTWNGGVAPNLSGGPVPRTLRFSGTGGAASTLRIYVLGIRNNTELRG